jgi:hypothetical protein
MNLIFLNVQNNTQAQENSEPESSDDSTSDMWCKAEEKPNIKRFLGTAVLHIVIDNPECDVQVMRSIHIDQQLRKGTFCTVGRSWISEVQL